MKLDNYTYDAFWKQDNKVNMWWIKFMKLDNNIYDVVINKNNN